MIKSLHRSSAFKNVWINVQMNGKLKANSFIYLYAFVINNIKSKI